MISFFYFRKLVMQTEQHNRPQLAHTVCAVFTLCHISLMMAFNSLFWMSRLFLFCPNIFIVVDKNSIISCFSQKWLGELTGHKDILYIWSSVCCGFPVSFHCCLFLISSLCQYFHLAFPDHPSSLSIPPFLSLCFFCHNPILSSTPPHPHPQHAPVRFQ